MLEKFLNMSFITENTIVFSIIYMKSFSIRYSILLVRWKDMLAFIAAWFSLPWKPIYTFNSSKRHWEYNSVNICKIWQIENLLNILYVLSNHQNISYHCSQQDTHKMCETVINAEVSLNSIPKVFWCILPPAILFMVDLIFHHWILDF